MGDEIKDFECGHCSGRGYIMDGKKKQIDCPVCKGTGKITVRWRSPDGR